MRNLVILPGSSHPNLVNKICARLGMQPGSVKSSKFMNQETNVEIKQSVRGQDVYIIQTCNENVNDSFMELMIMVHSCKIASANKVVVVIPHFFYSRQPDGPYAKLPKDIERHRICSAQSNEDTGFSSKDELDPVTNLSFNYRGWTARSGTLIANLLSVAGCDHVITLDLHDPQFQGYFDIPVDNLYCKPLIIHQVEQVKGWKNAAICSPDAGGAKRAAIIAEELGLEFVLIHKKTTKQRQHMLLVGDVKDRLCIIIDDMADTCKTIARASHLLMDNGASRVCAIVTHGVFSDNAIDLINNSPIDEITVSNTIPQVAHLDRCPKLKVFDASGLLSEAIRRIHHGESVSMLFDVAPF